MAATIDGCNCLSEIKIVHLTDRFQLKTTQYCWNNAWLKPVLEINIPQLEESVDNCKISHEINNIYFKGWLAAIFFVRKTNNLLQRMNGCHFFSWEKQITYFKGWIAAIFFSWEKQITYFKGWMTAIFFRKKNK